MWFVFLVGFIFLESLIATSHCLDYSPLESCLTIGFKVESYQMTKRQQHMVALDLPIYEILRLYFVMARFSAQFGTQ